MGLLIAASVHYVLPWLLPLMVANARPILGVAAAVAVLAVLDCLQRPWFVELQRQGLSDAPRRVWRVQHVSYWMTTMLHRPPRQDPFEAQLQLSQLEYVCSSHAASTTLAENYVGLERV